MVNDNEANKIIKLCEGLTRSDCVAVIKALYEAIEASDDYYIFTMNVKAREALKKRGIN